MHLLNQQEAIQADLNRLEAESDFLKVELPFWLMLFAICLGIAGHLFALNDVYALSIVFIFLASLNIALTGSIVLACLGIESAGLTSVMAFTSVFYFSLPVFSYFFSAIIALMALYICYLLSQSIQEKLQVNQSRLNDLKREKRHQTAY